MPGKTSFPILFVFLVIGSLEASGKISSSNPGKIVSLSSGSIGITGGSISCSTGTGFFRGLPLPLLTGIACSCTSGIGFFRGLPLPLLGCTIGSSGIMFCSIVEYFSFFFCSFIFPLFSSSF